MKLRYKLISLHSALAGFAVLTAAATIYGVHIHVRIAIGTFEDLIEKSHQVDQLQVEARSQIVNLREIVRGEKTANESYIAKRDAFFSRLDALSRFAQPSSQSVAWEGLSQVSDRLRSDFEECEEMHKQGNVESALEILNNRIEGDLYVAMDMRLSEIDHELETLRREQLDEVYITKISLLALAGVIGLLSALFVVVSAYLVQRWLLQPIRLLQDGATEFAHGRLGHRLSLRGDDEFGSLAGTLNSMASSLDVSQAKYRSLFENMSDAVVICDASGCVVEAHEGDFNLLYIDPATAADKPFLEAWPNWRDACDWPAILAEVSREKRQIRHVDVSLEQPDGESRIVDVMAYPIQFGGTQYIAIVLRDVVERVRLQKIERRAETMDVAESFARGIAHDFKNLLNSVATTLSIVRDQPGNSKNPARIQSGLHACRQAASLSNRLLSLSCSHEGTPELLDISEMIDDVLGALEEPLLEGIDVVRNLEPRVVAAIDRDHLTQVILNLLRNAREAMADSGTLSISSRIAKAVNPLEGGAPSRYCRIEIKDTGVGMDDETRERIFEPLFSTKPRDDQGVRGLGMSFVYSAVRTAGGFVQVASERDRGTTVEVYLPFADRLPVGSRKIRAAEPLAIQSDRVPQDGQNKERPSVEEKLKND